MIAITVDAAGVFTPVQNAKPDQANIIAPAVAEPQSVAELPGDIVARIETQIASEMARLKIPGLSVAIAIDNHIRYANGFGMADLENSVPAKATTVYRTASVAKPITATAVMQLVERGKLDLGTAVQKYCPAFPAKPWPITIRQLLAHQGGIRHTGKDKAMEHYFSIEESLKLFKDDPLVCEPGTKYSYTTYGYSLLGCAIEGASGKRYEDYMREYVFSPAGMERTRADDYFEIIPDRAAEYRRLNEKDYSQLPSAGKAKFKPGQILNASLHDTSMKVPRGGLVSTSADLVKFGIAVQTGVLLKKTTLEQMWTLQRNEKVKNTVHSLGWAVITFGGTRMATYNGNQPGVSTDLTLLPEKGIVVAVMANLDGVSLDAIRNFLLATALSASRP